MTTPAVSRAEFGVWRDGTPVEAFVIRCGELELQAISLGAIITSLRCPDTDGHVESVVLGYDTLDEYRSNPHYLGAVVGRYANRIAHGRFTLEGRTYTLAGNDRGHHLHGGAAGFDQRIWIGTPAVGDSWAAVSFSRTSPAGEEGYPGTLAVRVTYRLLAPATVRIEYEATADATTIVNLTQHSYFNLSGSRRTSVLDHELFLAADRFTPTDAALIPTGELAPVEGTPFDFRTAREIRTQIGVPHPQLDAGGGFDHNFVLGGTTRNDDRELRTAAELRDPSSGRRLVLSTTEPGIQLYTGQLLARGPHGPAPPFSAHAGLCLETQHFPDAPNQPHFPSTLLRPSETYRSITTWEFRS